MQKIKPKALTVFYILSTYILFQFGWWTWLLIDLNHQVSGLQEMITGDKNIPAVFSGNKTMMVIGEGAVFLCLLVLGAIYILRSFKKEVQLAHQQQNFLLSITHELKTPIASAKLYLQTLLKRELPEQKRKEILNAVLQENERLNKLVEQMLMAAKVDSKAYELYLAPFDLSKALGAFVAKLKEQNIPINSKIENGLVINADEMAMMSIFSNLFDNAIKYGDKNKPIEVQLSGNQDKITLEVADYGAGIHHLEKQKIFDRFYRIGNEETRKTKGTGLGLYIVKTLVEMHHAVIEVKDNSPGGTVFVVQFNIE